MINSKTKDKKLAAAMRELNEVPTIANAHKAKGVSRFVSLYNVTVYGLHPKRNIDIAISPELGINPKIIRYLQGKGLRVVLDCPFEDAPDYDGQVVGVGADIRKQGKFEEIKQAIYFIYLARNGFVEL